MSSRCEIWRVERRCHRDDVSLCKALGKGEEGVTGFRQTCVERLVVEFFFVE